MELNRFDVLLINLDPTLGSEIKKTRPCVVISPNEMNHYLNTIIVAPMTSTIKHYPTRIDLEFDHKKGSIVLDQIRTIDRVRVVKKLGQLDKKIQTKVINVLLEMFDE